MNNILKFCTIILFASLISCKEKKGLNHNDSIELTKTNQKLNADSVMTTDTLISQNNINKEQQSNNGIDTIYEYYKNNSIKEKYLTKQGIKHGKYFSYYENGVIETEMEFKNGIKDGEYKMYWSNGNLKLMALISNEKTSWLKKFNSDGKLIMEEKYENRVTIESNIYDP